MRLRPRRRPSSFGEKTSAIYHSIYSSCRLLLCAPYSITIRMANPKLISGGIIAAAVSPRRSGEQSIDLSASLELLDFLFDGGVNGIALLGSTGEFVHFVLE